MILAFNCGSQEAGFLTEKTGPWGKLMKGQSETGFSDRWGQGKEVARERKCAEITKRGRETTFLRV